MILFVCSGNTCRSVAAELLARKLWETRGAGRRAVFASAGLDAFPGEPASEPLCRLLAAEEVDAGAHRASLVETEQVRRARLILVMTEAHRCRLLERFPEAAEKTHLLKEYAGLTGSSPEVEDPFGFPEKYRVMVEDIRRAVEKIVAKLSAGEIPYGEVP